MKMRPIWLAAMAALAGCGSPGLPRPPSLQLPRPVQDLRATRKANTVYLVWSLPLETTDQSTIRRMGVTRVCRSLQVGTTSCDMEVNEVPTDRLRIPPASKASNDKQQQESKSNPPQVTATDVLPRDLQTKDSNALVNYAVETFNKDGRSAGLSNQVQISLVPTLPSPTGLHAELTADGVALAWDNVRLESEISGASYKYRVYRKPEGTNADVLVGEVAQSKSPLIRFQDRSFAWEKTYAYRVTMVTLLSFEDKPQVQVEGDDSAPVTVVAHDVFPPATPAGLQPVFSGIGQKPFVDLTWAPNTDADLAGYKVYRREDGGNWVLLNGDLLKTPAFRDGNVVSGRNYEYAITAVDLRGNESARSEGAREVVPQ